MVIEILPPQLANQIAAGEVVERPSSVVKELVENSLDAGATQVDIQIEQGGSGLILIRDNGSGIGKEDLPFALARHATSKIKNMDDLISILSFGFRGEALASISSVSRLTLTSNTAEQSEAWQVYAEGREMNAVIKPAAHPVGTTVEVRNLFYNTPARRKFLRTEKTEFNHIDEIIRRIALVRHDVTFTLLHNGKKIRHYRSVMSQDDVSQKKNRIAAICGNRFVEYARHILWDHFDLSLEGWIMPAVEDLLEANQSVPNIQYCYVNGRIVRDKVIMHALKQAFQTAYPSIAHSDEKLSYVIYLNISPEEVDVNVHPAKHEVRFHQSRLVHDFIFQAVMQSLQVTEPSMDILDVSDLLDDSPTAETRIRDTNRASAGSNQFAGQRASQSGTTTKIEASAAKAELIQSDSSGQSMVSTGEMGDTSSSSNLNKDRGTLASSANLSELEQSDLDSNRYQQLFPKRDKPFELNSLYTDQNASVIGKSYQKDPQNHPLSGTEKVSYQQLMTPANSARLEQTQRGILEGAAQSHTCGKALYVLNQTHLLLVRSSDESNGQEQLNLLCLFTASIELKALQFSHVIKQQIAQPLLVPITLKLSAAEWDKYTQYEALMQQLQIIHQANKKQKSVEIQSVPAPLRHGDIAKYVTKLLGHWMNKAVDTVLKNDDEVTLQDAIYFMSKLLVEEQKGTEKYEWTLAEAINVVSELERMVPTSIEAYGAPMLQLISYS